MKKKFIAVIVLLSIGLSIMGTSCSIAAPKPLREKGEAVNIIVATDLHYLTEEYKEEGSVELRMTTSFGDGKQLIYMEYVTDAFLTEVIAAKPDALLLCGDLSYNGEKASHQALSEKLKKVKDAGIAVYLIPGNHDINIYAARAFYAAAGQRVDTVSPEEFDEIYKEFNTQAIVSKDETTRSFIVKLSPELFLIVLDDSLYEQNTNIKAQAGGFVTAETLQWLQENLQKIKTETGEATFIGAGHHNLLIHNELLYEDYVLDNNEELLAIFEMYNVPLYLSGHIHVQSVSEDERTGIYDISTAALAISPSQYGVIQFIPGEKLTYAAKETDVENYSISIENADENLRHFSNYNQNYFYKVAYHKAYSEMILAGMAEEESKMLADVQAELTTAYFAGYTDFKEENYLEDERYQLYLEKGPMSTYMQSMLSGKNNRELTIVLPK